MELFELLLAGAPLVVVVAEVAEPGSFLVEPDGEAEGALTLPEAELVWTWTLGFFVLVAVPVAVLALFGLAAAVMFATRSFQAFRRQSL